MSVWLEALVPALAALAISVVPGALVAWFGGFRGFAAFGLGPLLSATLVGGAAVVAPWLHLRWGVLPLLLATIVSALVLWAVRRGAKRMEARLPADDGVRRSVGALRLQRVEPRRQTQTSARSSAAALRTPVTWATLAGLAVSVVVLGRRLTSIFRSPDLVSQTADNVFHLNAVRYILDGGNGSSLTLREAGGTQAALYPGAWHDLVALVVQSTGASIPVSVAAVNLVIGAVLWPVSVIFLARTVFGNSKIVDLSAAALACCFSAFPYLLVDWGVLYPNYYGMAVVPAFVALGVLLAKWRHLRAGLVAATALCFLVSCVGLLLVHPNTVLTAGVVLVPLWVARLAASVRSSPGSGRSRWVPAVGLVAVLVGAALIWVKLRPFVITHFGDSWPPYETPAQALGEFFLTTHSGWIAGYATSLLFVVGLFVCARRRRWRWLLVGAVLWAVLFVDVAGYPNSVVRSFLTGGWYSDFRRIAAGAALMALLVALAGVKAVAQRIGAGLRRVEWVKPRLRTHVRLIATVAVLLAVGAQAQTGDIPQAARHAQSNYNIGPGSPIMSSDELALYEKLDTLVPPGAMIAGNPWDGSAWAYFVSGRRVLFPHVVTLWTPDRTLIAEKLNQAAGDPQVCAALQRLHVEYALTSDELIYLPGNIANTEYPGMAGLELSKGFQLVAQVGQNRLFRITACQH